MDINTVICLSGGLDSVTTLAMALDRGDQCMGLSFDYGQRHRAELLASERLAKHYDIPHHVFRLDLSAFDVSSLTNADLDIPLAQARGDGIPNTYVPARNTIFLSIALGLAESVGAQWIGLGINAVDYSGYPDCRPEYIEIFERLAVLATAVGSKGGQAPKIYAPLVTMSKAEIIRAGMDLGIDYSQSVSCYQATDAGLACGRCESCHYRRQGFLDAGIMDPTRYI